MDMKDKKILVIGGAASALSGSHVVEKFLKEPIAEVEERRMKGY